jgi:hypothetical protein
MTLHVLTLDGAWCPNSHGLLGISTGVCQCSGLSWTMSWSTGVNCSQGPRTLTPTLWLSEGAGSSLEGPSCPRTFGSPFGHLMSDIFINMHSLLSSQPPTPQPMLPQCPTPPRTSEPTSLQLLTLQRYKEEGGPSSKRQCKTQRIQTSSAGSSARRLLLQRAIMSSRVCSAAVLTLSSGHGRAGLDGSSVV